MVVYTMDKKPSLISRRNDEPDFNLREWALKAHISRDQNIKSRRYSASNIRSFREEAIARSFRSSTTISSTVSSPGYTLKDEIINPYTYSFTTALKALQARSGYGFECVSPDGFSLSLSSKWNEAERYISNPVSGEVPTECLSMKTLSERSSRITVSGPLVYSSRVPYIQTKPTVMKQENGVFQYSSLQGKKVDSFTRDVGTQSTPTEISSSSPSPSSTPSLKRCDTEGGGSSISGTKSSPEEEIEMTREKGEEEEATMKKKNNGGCIPYWKKNVWMRKKQKRENQNCGWQVLFWKRNNVKMIKK